MDRSRRGGRQAAQADDTLRRFAEDSAFRDTSRYLLKDLQALSMHRKQGVSKRLAPAFPRGTDPLRLRSDDRMRRPCAGDHTNSIIAIKLSTSSGTPSARRAAATHGSHRRIFSRLCARSRTIAIDIG